jgi:hypothetical protein
MGIGMEYIGNIIYDDSLMAENRKFVIFGAGKCGKCILQYLDINGKKDNILCFCVSCSSKAEQCIESIPVICAQEAFIKYPDADYLISGKYLKEMYFTLKDSLIEKIHLLFI